MTEQKHALGRGLDALFSDDSETFSLENLGLSENAQTLPVEKIKVCSYQPRQDFNEEGLEELAQSIRQKGVLEPILVRPKGDFFEIVAGERRYRAALKANLKEIPVVQKDLSDVEAFEISMIENLMRKNLNPIEEAGGFYTLSEEYHLTHESISQSVGKSRSYITNSLRLLELPKSVQNFVALSKLSVGHVRPLIGLENAEEIALEIINQNLSVRQTEDLINKIKNGKKEKKVFTPSDDVLKLQDELSRRYNVKTQISFNKKGKGKIVLSYNNFIELEELLAKLER